MTKMLPVDFDRSRSYTTSEISKMLDIPGPTIHAWVARGEFGPVGKRGRANVFSGADVEKMARYREDNPGHESSSSTESVPMAATAVLATLAEVEREEAVDGHRYWFSSEVTGAAKAEEMTFGPIKLHVVLSNTREGQARVPKQDKHFRLDPGEAVVLANALANAENTWIFGPTGAGKTSGIKQMCALLNWPLYRVNMSGDISLDDFVGLPEVAIDETTGQAVTRFADGILIQAMLNGGVLLIDEFTATPAHVLMILQGVLERANDPAACWKEGESHVEFVNTANGGEVIHAHPRFRIIVTDNTNGQGDETGAYAGTNTMNEATRSRFTQWLLKSYPDEAAWRAMLKDKEGVSADVAKAIVQIAMEVNKGSALLGAETVTNGIVISPRDTLAIARLSRTFGDIGIAFRIGVINSMNSNDPDAQFLGDLIRAKLGF